MLNLLSRLRLLNWLNICIQTKVLKTMVVLKFGVGVSIVPEDACTSEIEHHCYDELVDSLSDYHLPHADGDKRSRLWSRFSIKNLICRRIGRQNQSCWSVHETRFACPHVPFCRCPPLSVDTGRGGCRLWAVQPHPIPPCLSLDTTSSQTRRHEMMM